MDDRGAAIRRLAPDHTNSDEVTAAEQFLEWTGNHRQLERALAAPGAVPNFRTLALENGLEELITAVGRSTLPAGLPGDTAQDQRKAFAQQLRRGLFQREPTAVLQRMVQDGEISLPGLAIRTVSYRSSTTLVMGSTCESTRSPPR